MAFSKFTDSFRFWQTCKPPIRLDQLVRQPLTFPGKTLRPTRFQSIPVLVLTTQKELCNFWRQQRSMMGLYIIPEISANSFLNVFWLFVFFISTIESGVCVDTERKPKFYIAIEINKWVYVLIQAHWYFPTWSFFQLAKARANERTHSVDGISSNLNSIFPNSWFQLVGPCHMVHVITESGWDMEGSLER